jgi:hypothetical protein
MTKDIVGKISFNASALKKTIFHSLVFGQEEDFQMAGGSFGGEIKKDKISVHKSFAGVAGSESNLNYSDEDYVRLVEFEDLLYRNKMFVVGWYVSFENFQKLFNEINRKTHLGYQQNNPKAFVMVINPLNVVADKLGELIKIYRLKDPTSTEFDQKAWIKLEFELLKTDESTFMDDINKNKGEIIKGATEFLFSYALLDDFLDKKCG